MKLLIEGQNRTGNQQHHPSNARILYVILNERSSFVWLAVCISVGASRTGEI
jgi:hypothetical protein